MLTSVQYGQELWSALSSRVHRQPKDMVTAMTKAANDWQLPPAACAALPYVTRAGILYRPARLTCIVHDLMWIILLILQRLVC